MLRLFRTCWPGYSRTSLAILGFVLISSAVLASEQSNAPVPSKPATLTVHLLDLQNRPLISIQVYVVDEHGVELSRKTGNDGTCQFSALMAGKYGVRIESTDHRGGTAASVILSDGENRVLDLTLGNAKSSGDNRSATSMPEFFDDPKFTAAGVTDTSNLGGHASAVRMPTSEALLRSASSLGSGAGKAPLSADSVQLLRTQADREPGNFELNYGAGNALLENGDAHSAILYLERAAGIKAYEANTYQLARAYSQDKNYPQARAVAQSLVAKSNTAQAHHLLATVEEEAGNPLEAAKEFRRAAELDPTESNLFDWASELLLHHAFVPSAQVFSKGNQLFPRSQRMLVGLAIARYSAGDDEQAAQRLCEASDLDPENPMPYEFMGRILTSANLQSKEVSERLARFAELQPNNALSNYYYALGLWKQTRVQNDKAQSRKIEQLLQKAVQLDPKLGSGYLQLGILYVDRGDASRAMEAFQKAAAVSPELPDAHYRLAHAYTGLGEKVKAEHELALYKQTSKLAEAERERQQREVRKLVFTLQDNTASTGPN